MRHASHPAIIKRLRRAEGHLRSILNMFDEGRGCMELAQQLHAVEAAIGNAKRELIQDHIAHCLDDHGKDGGDPRALVGELKSLARYL